MLAPAKCLLVCVSIGKMSCGLALAAQCNRRELKNSWPGEYRLVMGGQFCYCLYRVDYIQGLHTNNHMKAQSEQKIL